MFAQSLRIAARPLARPLARSISTTVPKRADLVQEIYLRELRAYKPPTLTAADAEGQVKKWTPPAAAQVPEGYTGLTNDLDAYVKQEVEVEGAAEVSESGVVVEEDWFEEAEAFPAEESKAH